MCYLIAHLEFLLQLICINILISLLNPRILCGIYNLPCHHQWFIHMFTHFPLFLHPLLDLYALLLLVSLRSSHQTNHLIIHLPHVLPFHQPVCVLLEIFFFCSSFHNHRTSQNISLIIKDFWNLVTVQLLNFWTVYSRTSEMVNNCCRCGSVAQRTACHCLVRHSKVKFEKISC